MASGAKLDLAAVYRDHGYIVLRRARQILSDTEEAREALQEVFLSLANRPDQFSGESSIATFLYRVTTNHCLNRLRNHRRRSRLAEGAVVNGSWTTHAEEIVDAEAALRRLPEKLAQVAVYYYIDEMTQDEIASVLGCSRRTVGKRLARLHREIESWVP
jgi:RNA polymerase sigma-70 factor (ECF subfamily)